MKSSSRDTGDVESGFDDAASRRSGDVAIRRVVAQRRDRDSRAYLVSQVITKLDVAHEAPQYLQPLLALVPKAS
jgi:hypothetical protein